jgi:ethanolamine utilization protein EutN
MIKATVTGRVWSTKRLQEMPVGSILEVKIDDSSATLLAFDPLSCGIGEKVIIATGSVAASWFAGKVPPIDALIIGLIDETSNN